MTKNTVLRQYNSPNYTANGNVRGAFGYPRSIDYITIHWWGAPNTNPTFEGVISWLSQTRSQVSAHDIITGTGHRVAVMVDYNNAAWHAGNARGNATSLGFECDPRCRPEDYEAVAQDVAETWQYYGRKIPLVPHNTWTSTQCPGNYDLNKIHRMASDIYDGKPAPAPTPKPTPPAVKLVKTTTFNPAKRFTVKSDTKLVNIPANTAYSAQVFKAGSVIEEVVELLEYSNGGLYFRTRYARDTAKKMYGFTTASLQEVGVAPPKPEWLQNYKDIADTKLTVLPAAGTAVYDLVTLKVIPNTVIPKGTQVDIAAETTVNGIKYYQTKYSFDHGVSNGIKASDVGVPVVPPVVEKPEWVKNLKDIEDKDFWTRSDTPVLNLADGTVAKTLPINTKVRIIKATTVIGKDLLVLDGEKTAIEVVYLSDTPLVKPTEDLEARVTALEKLVKAISDFLSSVFANFKK